MALRHDNDEARRDAERDIAQQYDYESRLLDEFNCHITSWEDGPISIEDEDGCPLRFEESEWRFVRALMEELRIRNTEVSQV